MEIGKSYYIETPTKFWCGKIVDIVAGFLLLENASWIADTGRFADFMKHGVPNEVEPVGKWKLNMVYVSGYEEYPGELPTEQK